MTAPKDKPKTLRDRCEGAAMDLAPMRGRIVEAEVSDVADAMVTLVCAERVRFAEMAIWLAAGCIVDTKAIKDAIAAAEGDGE